MPASALIPKLLLGTIGIAAVGIGLTTYTQPNHGGPTYDDLELLLRTALGDSQPQLPPPPRSLGLEPVNLPADSTPRAGNNPGEELASAQPTMWVAQALARDSAALRGWLGATVLVTAAARGDTIHTRLWRVTAHAGCPWLSQLRAVSVRYRLVLVEADCPGPAPRDDSVPHSFSPISRTDALSYREVPRSHLSVAPSRF